jgi:surface polysaccharide O-acyltransferase-like enzyme
MVVPLVFGSYVYLLWWTYNRVQPAPDLNPLSLLKGPVVFHLWFFYTLLGVYLFLPLLQGLYRKARSLHFFYLAMVMIAASIIPMLRDFGVSVPIGVDLQYFAQYAGYTFAGAVLAGIRPTAWQTVLAGVLGFVVSMGTALWTWQLSVSSGAPLETVFVYHAPLVALAAAAFFVAFRGIGSNFVQRVPAGITHFVAQNAVGIFIFHIFFIDQVYARGFAPDFINPWIGIPISSGIVWGASLIASAAIRALPYGKSLLP